MSEIIKTKQTLEEYMTKKEYASTFTKLVRGNPISGIYFVGDIRGNNAFITYLEKYFPCIEQNGSLKRIKVTLTFILSKVNLE